MEGDNNMEKGLLLTNKEETARTTLLLVFSTFIIVCASFTFGVSAGYTADTMSSIMRDLDLSLAQFSLFGSLMTFGGMIGAIFSAKAASALGNKMTLWLADLFCITGWVAIALAKDIVLLDLGRFFVGIGVGLISYVVPVYVAEITPKHIRGAFTFSNQLLQNCGVAIAYYFGNFLSWRSLALIGIIPCGIQVIGLFFIPESPRWLAKKGRDEEVEVVLQKLRGKGHDIMFEARAIKISVEVSKQNSNTSIRSLFRKRYAHQLTIGIGLMLLQQLCGMSGIGSYGSTLFELGGFSARIGMTVLSLIVVPKSVMGLILVDRWGRRPLLMASAFGLCLSCITLAVAFGVKDVPEIQNITPVFTFIGILSFTMMFAFGMGALPWVIMSEIFPMDIKVLAGSLVTIANWFTGWIANYCFNFMLVWSPAEMSLKLYFSLHSSSLKNAKPSSILIAQQSPGDRKTSPAEEFSPLAEKFNRRLLLGIGSSSVLAIGANFGGVTSFVLGLSPEFGRNLKLDVVYPISGYRRCMDTVEGFEFIYPATWVGDQTLLYRAAEKSERETSLDLPPARISRRKNVNEPVVAFGPPGSTGELNVSVIVSPVSPTFSIEAFGGPKEVGEAIVKTVTRSGQRTDLKGTLLEANLRQDSERNLKYYELEFKVESPSFRRHNVAVCCANGGRLYTLNAQVPESAWSELKHEFHTIAKSFNIIS
ncbi:unnamed protein product [Brassica oleracea]|uniref:Major facilitator superfamily (MFS) profile domain-containing protein n=1 Tax=Brassica oleracea TaxID=3712 RepID=A0A3P6FNT5_BRAOL|nr:unnamed protein product [Brassica oleracea]